MKEEYKYVWEKSRNLYRVVIDHPAYDKESQKTIHHYVCYVRKNGAANSPERSELAA